MTDTEGQHLPLAFITNSQRGAIWLGGAFIFTPEEKENSCTGEERQPGSLQGKTAYDWSAYGIARRDAGCQARSRTWGREVTVLFIGL